jgi:hypothetical protein
MREADELATDLGHLPLALAQAAAFMLDRGDTCTRYRARLADRRRRLAELFPPDALADDYRVTVAATWSISIDAADALQPPGLARPVLELLSILDANGVPTALLRTDIAVAYASYRGATPPREAQDLTDALHHLARLSLVTVDPGGGAAGVRVHGLVQPPSSSSSTGNGSACCTRGRSVHCRRSGRTSNATPNSARCCAQTPPR